ncbi:acetyltransferase (GNAT) family protein [Cytobacillus oceanisediminis]|uniref:Acetyltransferase (GNAT) family protein n=1 Tax=Cytobacillus oceanisediminis TaxID=665099 RepID=A0A2V2ZXE3_9BACI|nr:GNAT family N-acetyltransferase [Cytobacillus oceanisediminis]PWW28350.1 acetyltransferase (GNAT) family protein [Cytobacillus oceanisediminis]
MKSVNFNVPKLETVRLMLRKLTLGDLEDMHTYTSSIEVTKYVPFPDQKSLADIEAFIQDVMEQYENNKTAPWG